MTTILILTDGTTREPLVVPALAGFFGRPTKAGMTCAPE